VASFVEDPIDVTIATETDRGLFVGALVVAGYRVFAVNPMSTSRYRERHSTSGAKSDPGDAFVLAELARTDAHNHRLVAGDSDLAEGIKVLARAHQGLIWTRQRQTNQLRSMLREFYPAALEAFDDLGSGDALAVLAVAPTPAAGRQLSVTFEDRFSVAARWTPTSHRRTSRADPGGVTHPATRSRADRCRGDGRHCHRARRGRSRAGHPDHPARDRAGRPF